MKLTNVMKLPKALEVFIQRTVAEPHNKSGQYSATTLQNGIRETILTNRHFEEIETDVADELWATFGSAFHLLMEHEAQQGDGTVSESKVCVVLPDGGAVTGRMDLFTPAAGGTGIVEDYKTCKTYAIIFPETPEKWKDQLKSYCAILAKTGVDARKVRIIALLKDWTPREARIKKNSGYPQKPVVTLEWEFAMDELTAKWQEIIARVKTLQEAEKLSDDYLPLCSPEERWAKPETFAIKKLEHVKAMKCCSSMREAEAVLDAPQTKEITVKDADGKKVKKEIDNRLRIQGYIVQRRPGENTKCAEYCRCYNFCNFYKEHVAPELTEGDNNGD